MRWVAYLSLLFTLTGCRSLAVDQNARLLRWDRPRSDAPKRLAPPREIIIDAPGVTPPPRRATFGTPRADTRVVQTVALTPAQPGKDKKALSMVERLRFPQEALGFKIDDITLPPANAPPKVRQDAINKQFPPLPKMFELPAAKPGPNGRKLTLDDLQQMALASNPLIRQAQADIVGARGAAIQAGLYPNPVMGYETDTLGQANPDGKRSAGQQGGYIEQLIKTPGKLRLARLAAQYDLEVAEKKLKQAQADVQAQVRGQYFAVLSAKMNFEVMQSLAKFTDEVYTVLLLQLQAGEVAAYEPMQTRVLAMQARGQLVQAHNRYVSAWKQLAAALGAPATPLTEVAGRIDMPVPRFEHEDVLRFVLANHTDIQNAQYGVERARALLQLAQMQPIPDMAIGYVMQRDMTSNPQFLTQNIRLGFSLPVFDRNQGNIQQARAWLVRAMQEDGRVRNDLSARAAAAFERYENNRVLLDMYKKQMLPNQVQAFRAAVARHAAVGDVKNVSYNDIVMSQQTLANLITQYLVALAEQWASVVEIGQLMQTNDLFNAQRVDEVAPVPDIHELFRRGR
ncbi:MAG: TolC family protein [Planctomycetes bacterium]|nr:TolC family protein [Planctomycetota bacterium]